MTPWSDPKAVRSRKFTGHITHLTRAVQVVNFAAEDLGDFLAHKVVESAGRSHHGILRFESELFPFDESGQLVSGLSIRDDQARPQTVEHPDKPPHLLGRHPKRIHPGGV